MKRGVTAGHPLRRLTDDEVRWIVFDYWTGGKPRNIAEEYGVSVQTVYYHSEMYYRKKLLDTAEKPSL